MLCLFRKSDCRRGKVQHLGSHWIPSMTPKLQAIQLGNIMSSPGLFLKKKPYFRNGVGQEAEVPQSEFFPCAMQAKPNSSNCVSLVLQENTHNTSFLCFPPQHTQRLQTQQAEEPLRNLKSFGLMTHLIAAISTSQPNTGTGGEDPKIEQREMSFF